MNPNSDLIARVSSIVVDDPSVLALVLGGSMARTDHDAFSDVDMLLVVTPAGFVSYFEEVAWLSRLELSVVALRQLPAPLRGLLRICFEGPRRLDLLVVPHVDLPALLSRPTMVSGGWKIICSREPNVEGILLGASEVQLSGPIKPGWGEAEDLQLWDSFAAISSAARRRRRDALAATLRILERTLNLDGDLRDAPAVIELFDAFAEAQIWSSRSLAGLTPIIELAAEVWEIHAPAWTSGRTQAVADFRGAADSHLTSAGVLKRQIL